MLEDKHGSSVGEFDSTSKLHYFYIKSPHLRHSFVNIRPIIPSFCLEGVKRAVGVKRTEKHGKEEKKTLL